MKKHVCVIGIVISIWAAALVPAAAEEGAPRRFMTVTVKSYRALADSLARLANAVMPGMGMQVQGMLPAVFGLKGVEGLDTAKPLYVVAGTAGTEDGRMVPALFLPVTDVDAFSAAILPGGGLGKLKGAKSRVVDGYLMLLKPGNALPGRGDALGKWKPAGGDVRHLVSVDIRVAPLRPFIMKRLDMVRAAVAAGIAGAAAGAEPRDVQAAVGMYVDAVKGIVEGSDRIVFTLDVEREALVARVVLHPVAGKPLAAFTKAPSLDIGGVTAYLDADAFLSCAGVMEKRGELDAAAEKIVRLAMRMQGVAADAVEETAKEVKEYMADMFPFRFACLTNMSDTGYEFMYVFQTDEGRAGKNFAALEKFYLRTAKLLPGKGVYGKMEVQRGVRSVGDVSVSRVGLVLNKEHPRVKALAGTPLLKDMVYEYARVGDTILVATPRFMDSLIDRVKKHPAGKTVEKNTVFLGSLNLFALAKGITMMLPMVPPPVKALFQGPVPDGTAIGCAVKTDGNVEATVTVPLALLKQAGQTFMRMKAMQGGAVPPPGGNVPGGAPRGNKGGAPIF